MLPKIQKPDGIRKITQVEFGGYDRRPEAGDGTFRDTQRMSAEKAPLLSARKLYAYQNNDTSFVFGNDALLEIRRDGEIWYNGWLLASFVRQDSNRRAVRFGKSWVILPDKVLLHTGPELKGRVANTTALEELTGVQEGDVWAVGSYGDGNDTAETNPYLYTWSGTAWVQGERVISSLESAVTIQTGRATFGDQYRTFEGGNTGWKIADMNSITDGSAQINFANYFKVGDAVKISGCTNQPKNNLTLTVREIEGSHLRFYENSFSVAEVSFIELTAALPALRTGTNYKVWYKGVGDYHQQDYSFTLPVDAEEGDVLVTAPLTTTDSALYLIQTWNGNRALACTMAHGSDKPTGTDPAQTEPEELTFEVGEDTWSGGVTEPGAITIEKRLPDMDYIFCDSNRLWGCKGSMIYASALGDPSVFYRFDGLADDSWSVEVFSPGSFTGAISHDGYPTFFKENMRYKIYGQTPEAYQLSELSCDGVQEGSDASLAIVGTSLFYLSPIGVMEDTGSIPRCVSRQLGTAAWERGCAGAGDRQYVISMQKSGSSPAEWQTFFYDVSHGVWLRDERRQYTSFATVNGVLYGRKSDGKLIRMADAVTGWTAEAAAESLIETNDFTLKEPNRKRLHRVQLRVSVGQGASLQIKVQYDGGSWRDVGTLTGNVQKSFYIPVKLWRCDRFALRFIGLGDWTLYSLAIEVVRGSAVH